MADIPLKQTKLNMCVDVVKKDVNTWHLQLTMEHWPKHLQQCPFLRWKNHKLIKTNKSMIFCWTQHLKKYI